MARRKSTSCESSYAGLWLPSLMSLSLLFSGSLVFHLQARALDTVDESTQDLLLEKLTRVYLSLPPADASRVGVAMRLADLHAEKARRLAMRELNEGCVKCLAGASDRKKALQYYRDVQAKAPVESAGKIAIQIGHLHELLGQNQEAKAAYAGILSAKVNPVSIAEAQLSLAEMAFKQGDFAEAQKYYQMVFDNSASLMGARSLAAYRLAWCSFNRGHLEQAILGLENVLKDKDLLVRSAVDRTSNSGQIDLQFHEEVSRDYSTFLSRRAINKIDLDNVFVLSPNSTKLANLTYLALESERLGQKPAAIMVWDFVFQKQTQPKLRVESLVHQAQMQMDLKNKVEAARAFDLALTTWSQMGGCVDAECVELKTRIRNFLVDWTKLKNPSPELLQAYRNYLAVFSVEDDMRVAAGQVARDLKLYPEAIDLYNQAATGFKQAVQTNSGDEKSRAKYVQLLEDTLLGAIEVAEVAKENEVLAKELNLYIQNSISQKKNIEVRYQLAHMVYEKGEYLKAADMMREIALSSIAGGEPIKMQAADLALDSLVLAKGDAQAETKIESWAMEFARVFSSKAADYRLVARKALLNQAIARADDPAQALAILSKIDMNGAQAEELKTYYKNKMLLAEKAKNPSVVLSSADGLLGLKLDGGLSEEDRLLVLSRKAWASEMLLDFPGALAATEKLSLKDGASQKWIKLALYADLANQDSKPYLQKFLQESKDPEKARAIAARMVRECGFAFAEIEKQKSVLNSDPELLAGLYLESFARTPKVEIRKLVLKSPALAKTSSGKIFARAEFIAEFEPLAQKLKNHQVDGGQQKKLASSLKARVALLEQLEKMAKRAIAMSDWTSELLSLQLMAKESERFYNEIMSLPVPQGLKGEDEQQYLGALAQQASPYQTRSIETQAKVQEFWTNGASLEQLKKQYLEMNSEMQALTKLELQKVAEIAPEDKKSLFNFLGQVGTLTVAQVKADGETLHKIEAAKMKVRQEPNNRAFLQELLDLNKQVGREVWTAYLESRIQGLNDEKAPAKGVQ